MSALPTVKQCVSLSRSAVPTAEWPRAAQLCCRANDLSEMPHALVKGERMIPTIAFLESVEQHFHLKYPQEFTEFCRNGGTPETPLAAWRAAGVTFVCDLESLRMTNVQVGEGQWGDYEQAIAGRLHPKDGNRLWGGILPFAIRDTVIFGFDSERTQGGRVLAWSVHTIVYEYPTFGSFCADVRSWGQ